jgi:hypothetical protein
MMLRLRVEEARRAFLALFARFSESLSHGPVLTSLHPIAER